MRKTSRRPPWPCPQKS